MNNVPGFPEPAQLANRLEERAVMADHIRALSRGAGPLHILEAGCGPAWGLDLKGIQYTLTGIDLDKQALDIRLNTLKDLDVAICGDLRSVALEAGKYDVIVNAYVLEHVAGAEEVLTNFVRWLRPGGILLLVIPNRDSVKGFVARITPFWFHVFFRKHIIGEATAGKPGHAPYPTCFDEVVSRRGIYQFCEKHRLDIKAEYYLGYERPKNWISNACMAAISWVIHLGSFRTLSLKYVDLMYVLQKTSPDYG